MLEISHSSFPNEQGKKRRMGKKQKTIRRFSKNRKKVVAMMILILLMQSCCLNLMKSLVSGTVQMSQGDESSTGNNNNNLFFLSYMCLRSINRKIYKYCDAFAQKVKRKGQVMGRYHANKKTCYTTANGWWLRSTRTTQYLLNHCIHAFLCLLHF